jgi:hypothetical protein
MQIGIHTLVLHPEVDSQAFEALIVSKVFPLTAELPGSVNRGGVSAIQSQHLLKSESDNRTYWWLTKDSEALSSRTTFELIQSMYESVSEQLEPFCKLQSTTVFAVIEGLEVGPRDSLGRPLGKQTTGSDL